MKRKLISICLALATLFAFSGSAAAYTWTGGYFTSTPSGWGDGDFDFCFETQLTANQRVAVGRAYNNYWLQALNATYSNHGTNCASGPNIKVYLSDLGPCTLLGQATPPAAGDTFTDIHLNQNCPWYDGSALPVPNNLYDMQSVAAHEIGHALGLGHSQFTQKVMTSGYCANLGVRLNDLSQDDSDGMEARYPLMDKNPAQPASAPCVT